MIPSWELFSNYVVILTHDVDYDDDDDENDDDHLDDDYDDIQ